MPLPGDEAHNMILHNYFLGVLDDKQYLYNFK